MIMLAAADDGRPTVRRGARPKVSRDREGRARGRRDDSRVFTGSAALEKSLVNEVPQDIMFVSSAVGSVFVNGVAIHSKSGEERSKSPSKAHPPLRRTVGAALKL
eukprot:3187164-Pleurochrysis_carterae.AAC.1